MVFSAFKTNKEKIYGEDSSHPYVQARYEWNERYSSFIRDKKIWQMVALFTSFISIFAVLGIVYIGSKSKFIPYLVEVNKLGEAFSVKELDSVSNIDPRITRSQIAEFIKDVRTVTNDGKLKKEMMQRSAYFCSQNAYRTLLDYWNKNPPFEIAKVMNIEVEVHSALPIRGTNTWQTQWTETQIVNGTEGQKTSWQAMIQIGSFKSSEQNMSSILNNPTGLLVESINWAEVLE